ncbi:hypothetical protein INR49_024699 [Caranx melampygus]|nr:hypothetical protein INR49_024699 [Caranx melampygus]
MRPAPSSCRRAAARFTGGEVSAATGDQCRVSGLARSGPVQAAQQDAGRSHSGTVMAASVWLSPLARHAVPERMLGYLTLANRLQRKPAERKGREDKMAE